jgi:hypothetical protein
MFKARWGYSSGTHPFLSINANSNPVSRYAVMPSIAPSFRLRGFYVIRATPSHEIARERPYKLGLSSSTAKQKSSGGSETAVVGLSMRRSRWGTRGVYVGKLVAIRRPSQIRPTFREVPPKRYTASSSHGSDRVLACSSDGRRCTGRSANAI